MSDDPYKALQRRYEVRYIDLAQQVATQVSAAAWSTMSPEQVKAYTGRDVK